MDRRASTTATSFSPRSQQAWSAKSRRYSACYRWEGGGGGRKHAWQNIIAYILVSILSVAADPSTGHQLSASFTFSHTCSHHHIPHTTISTILSLSLSVTLTRANRLLPGFRVISTNLVARAMAFEPRMNVQNINNFLDSFFWTERISNGNTK